MYKVYFTVYISSRKCGNFKNIRHFFCDFVCVYRWKLVLSNICLLLFYVCTYPPSGDLSGAALEVPSEALLHPRSYVRAMQPTRMIAHARCTFEDTDLVCNEPTSKVQSRFAAKKCRECAKTRAEKCCGRAKIRAEKCYLLEYQ